MNNISDMDIGYDATFELNAFNEPKIRSELGTVKDVVLFILFAKPGQYPSLPHIGLDIESMLYSFYDEIQETDLKRKIIDQCEAVGVYFSDGTVDIKKVIYQGKPSIIINIEGTETYPSNYNKDSNSDRYLIGITFNELNKMIYNINHEGG